MVLLDLRNQLLTATAGEAIMTHRFLEYQTLKGGIPERQNGSLVSMENGSAIPYSIDKLTRSEVVSLLSQVRIFMKGKLLEKIHVKMIWLSILPRPKR